MHADHAVSSLYYKWNELLFCTGERLSIVCKQTIMSDSWLNIGHENDRLLPYKQPEQVIQDPLIGKPNLIVL